MWKTAILFILGACSIAGIIGKHQKKNDDHKPDFASAETPAQPAEACHLPDAAAEATGTVSDIYHKMIGEGGRILNFPGFEHPDLVKSYLEDVTDRPYIYFSAELEPVGDGRYLFIWEIQPDARYWADEDGFGWGDGVQLFLYAYVDGDGNFLSKLRIYELDRELFFGTDKEDIMAAR